MKKIFLLFLIIFCAKISIAQKSANQPKTTKLPSASPTCPVVVTIQDNNPNAECSELLKTLVAITNPCTDTTVVAYSWSSSIGGVFSTSRTTSFNLPEFIVSTPLTVSITVTDGSESQTADYTFLVKPRPNRPTISPIGALLLCDSNPITITSTGCNGGSTPIWNNGNLGLNTITVPAVGGTFFKMACQKDGCVSDSTSAVALVTGLNTSPPIVVSQIICEGSTVTAGNGLQAQTQNCGNGSTGTYTYTGPLVGYDQGYINTGGVDPTVSVPVTSNIIKKVTISITWRKQKGGFQNSCGTGDTESYPYHSETQFRIKSPSGKIINLVNTYTYGGTSNPTVTTVFEDGSSPVNFYSPPVSGTFSPAQPLSGFIGENPSGTWTLLPYDNVWKDPLCVSGFSVNFTAAQTGTVTWWDAPTGGNLLHTGNEYLPTETTAGIHTFFAQAQCINSCPSTRVATTLTIDPRPIAPEASINIPEISGTRIICGGESITLSASGCPSGSTVKWSSNVNGNYFATGNSHTFVPIFSNTADMAQTFTAACQGANLCYSLPSNNISLTVKRKPATPTISGSGSTACVNSNITLFASACSGGTLGWTGNRSGTSITFPITTNVDIKVACNVNGCTSDSSSVYSITTLPKPPVPTVNSSQVQAICIGGSVTLTANGCVNGGTVKWTGGLTGASITLTPITSRSYRASCLATNGCVSDSSAMLNIIVLPKTKPIITGPAFVCDPTLITLTATGCSGPNETVMWRDQSVGSTFADNVTQTKTYRAVCIRNGYCISDSSDVFTVDYRLKPATPTITPPLNSTVCQGTSISLTASACVGGTLNWTGGLMGQTINITAVGTKLFKVACTVNGCTSDSSEVISTTIIPKPSRPTITSSGNIVCEGQNITLTASACLGGSLEWTGGLIGQSISINSVGIRTFKVACTINNCTSDSSLVNATQIKPKPATPTITPPINSTVCQGVSISLSASSCVGGTLNWTGGLSGNLITITSIGTKLIKVACLINGCVSDSSAVQTITINPLPVFTVTSDKSEICEGENATLTVNGCAGTISWSNGAGNVASITVSPTINTTYTATCTQNGCSSNQQSTITALQTPKVTASGPLVCDQSITLTAENYPVGSTIQWRKDGVDISGATGITLVVNEAGNYDFAVGILNSTLFSTEVSENYWPLNFQLINSKIGFVTIGRKIKKTTDGGITWIDYNTNYDLKSIYFYDLSNGWAIASSGILKTIDGGISWNLASVVPETFNTVKFKTANIGMAISEGNVPYYTINGGNTWNAGNIFAPRNDYQPISSLEYVPNSNTIFVLTYKNNLESQLFKSTDGGLNWVNQTMSSYLANIQFVDSNTGWINGGKLLKTVDGGNTWNIKNTLNEANQPFGYLVSDFISNEVGYILNYQNGFYKTIDGGNTWKKILFNNFIDLDYLNKVDFVTEDIGWYTHTRSSLYHSINKISNPQCPTTPITITPPTNQASAITLSANRLEICSGESSTITTSACNGTLSWSNGAGNVNSITVSPTITTIYTATCTSGACTKTSQITITPLQTPRVVASGPLVCGQSVTLNAENFNQFSSGIQWRKNGVNISGATNISISVSEPGNYDFVVGNIFSNKLSVPYSQFGNIGVKFVNSNTGFFFSGNVIKKTSDGGNVWSDYNTDFEIQDLFFVNENYGWAVGLEKSIRTIDGGNTWLQYIGNEVISHQFFKVSFKNTLTGVAITNQISESFRSLQTIDGGQTWLMNSNYLSNANEHFAVNGIVWVPNTNRAISIGKNTYTNTGIIKITENNFANYSTINTTTSLYCISFVNQIGWIGTENGIFKSTNGGENWNFIAIPDIGTIQSIDFIDNQVGYAFGNAKILKTKDGGNTWFTFKMIEEDEYQFYLLAHKLDILSEDNGWFVNAHPDYYNAKLEKKTRAGINIFLNKISTPQCTTTPAIISPIPRPGGALVINTFKSGAWTDAGTWSCGFIPSSLDEVIINAGHTVTDSGNILNAKKLKFNGNGTLQLAPTTNLRLSN